MVDNSPVYEDGGFGNMQQPPRITHAAQSLSHYVDIVDETTKESSVAQTEHHVAPSAESLAPANPVPVDKLTPSASQA